MVFRATSLAFLALALPLVGCGGSSGSGTPAAGPQPSTMPQPPSASRSLTQVVADSRPATAVVAARSVPRLGSVTQSSNVDSDNVTVDHVSVAFNENDFTITQDADGTAGWTVASASAQRSNDVPEGGIGLVSQETGGQRIVVAFAREPAEGTTDWLAAGVWAFVPNSEEIEDYEFGAFADGGNPFPQENLAALTDSATYGGRAFGVYYADDPGGGEAGPFGADVSLTADFGDETDLGSISGEVSNVVTSSSRLDATLTLNSTEIGSAEGGFFTGSTSMSFDGRTYDGRWGGQFFGGGTGAPSSVAGTFGAATGADGATGSLVGAFSADRQDEQ